MSSNWSDSSFQTYTPPPECPSGVGQSDSYKAAGLPSTNIDLAAIVYGPFFIKLVLDSSPLKIEEKAEIPGKEALPRKHRLEEAEYKVPTPEEEEEEEKDSNENKVW